MYFHVLSCTFMYFHVLSCTFMYFHVLSCSFSGGQEFARRVQSDEWNQSKIPTLHNRHQDMCFVQPLVRTSLCTCRNKHTTCKPRCGKDLTGIGSCSLPLAAHANANQRECGLKVSTSREPPSRLTEVKCLGPIHLTIPNHRSRTCYLGANAKPMFNRCWGCHPQMHGQGAAT